VEWIDPLDAKTRWSPARADVAAVFGLMRYLQGDATGLKRAIDAVPPEYHDEPVVAFYRAFHELAVAADADAGDAILADHVPRTASDRNRMASARLFSQLVRLFAEPGSRVDDAAHAVSDAIVDSVRATGDDIELAFALITQAFVLANGGRPGAAYDAALEAEQLARAHGAGTYVDLVTNALTLVLARGGGQGVDRVAAAVELRRRLLETVARKSSSLGVASLAGAALLLVDHDPMTFHLVDQVRLRLQPRFPVLPDPADALGEVGAAEVRARADRLTFDDAIRLAINALDRLIDGSTQRRT
jgi:hypothetical protein